MYSTDRAYSGPVESCSTGRVWVDRSSFADSEQFCASFSFPYKYIFNFLILGLASFQKQFSFSFIFPWILLPPLDFQQPIELVIKEEVKDDDH